LFPKNTQTGSRAYLASCSRGFGVYAGVKRPGRGPENSSPSGAEVKDEWSCDTATAVCFHGIDSDNFTF